MTPGTLLRKAIPVRTEQWEAQFSGSPALRAGSSSTGKACRQANREQVAKFEKLKATLIPFALKRSIADLRHSEALISDRELIAA